jgi:hypothetical protein
MEFLDINLTKNSSLLVYAIHSIFYWRFYRKPLVLKIHIKKLAKQENSSLIMNSLQKPRLKMTFKIPSQDKDGWFIWTNIFTHIHSYTPTPTSVPSYSCHQMIYTQSVDNSDVKMLKLQLLREFLFRPTN